MSAPGKIDSGETLAAPRASAVEAANYWHQYEASYASTPIDDAAVIVVMIVVKKR